MKGKTSLVGLAIVIAVIVVAWLVIARVPGLTSDSAASPSTTSAISPSKPAPADDDTALIAQLFQKQKSDVEVHATGTVTRILSDDNDGSPHQRFVLRLSNGLTVLVAHNIDVAPRLNGLAVGDTVEFLGEYVWTEQGGTVHWTHHDPEGTHHDGWLKWDGKTYS